MWKRPRWSVRTSNMTSLTEASIEEWVIGLLAKQGYAFIHGPDIAPDSEADAPFKRASFSDVLLTEVLARAVQRINPKLDADTCRDAMKQVERIASPDLIAGNEKFHRLLTEGVTVTRQDRGQERGELAMLVDFHNPKNNTFHVINQFTVVENNINKRPDVILFVNGIPLVVFELKSAVDANATITSAFQQLQTYKAQIPTLFTYNGFTVISDGLEARAGTISSGFSRFMVWKSKDGRKEASQLSTQLETLIVGMLNPETLLDLIRHFVVFEKSKREYRETGLVQVSTEKKLAAYHQYYAVNRAVESTLRAAGFKKVESRLLNTDDIEQHSLALHGIQSGNPRKYKDRKGGVVWHTQGSGKSLTMVFYAGKIVQAMKNPTILVITDRNDLDDQLFDTFAASKQLLRQEPVQADNRGHLKELLKVASGGVVFTTIQKFQPDEGNVYDELSARENIILICDEAHRSQYGFQARTIDDKDAGGNVIGKKIVYGFAKYMREALPNATYLGFTGTPIENTDINTPAVFGNYVDIYDISQAVEDGATVRIYYESRLAKIKLSDEGKQLVSDLDKEIGTEEMDASQKAKAKWTKLEALVGSEERIELVAQDIVAHFEQRLMGMDGKALVVAMSRRIAADLYREITRLRPRWHSDDIKKGVVKVVMTAASSDGPEIAKHHTTKDQRRVLADRMKDPEDELKLAIVRDMWLTGFDSPSMHTLYIDKPIKGHNLMQAIARVNRVYRDKEGGLVVDYLGIASDLKDALSFYSESGGKGDPAATQEEAVNLMLEKLEVVSQMFHEFPYENYFDADTPGKLAMILAAENHVLGLEDGKKRFIDEVTALSKAFAIALPHDQAMDAKEEISFFQAVKARLVKFDAPGPGMSNVEMETAIRQVIDQALVGEKVIDVFDAAGLQKPEISILSDEFLQEVAGMEHKNLALEVLRKLLSDEIRGRARRNLVESKTLLEMLENSLKRYHAKVITAAEVIEELIQLSKEIKKKDEEPSAMGLTQIEYAFYCAVADNASARELMEKDKLRELAVELYKRVKENVSIDWTIKESVRSRLKVMVKRALREYGYPPDMQLLATETVLKQAELIAAELAG
ncbi:MAG: type I restriction endonuclease subunit R [Leptospirales bacterium]|nr:type I restriction endonuclease subunit R [Leptospirales bacterium]